METAQTVAQGVIAEGALGADPLWQEGMGQLCVELLQTGKAEQEGVEQGQEDAGGEMSGSWRASAMRWACARKSKPLLR